MLTNLKQKNPMVLRWIFLVTYISQIPTQSEILIYDAINTPQNVIQCLDPSSECIINCIGDNICSDKEIHCHNKSTTSICKINFNNGSHGGLRALIYTHTSPIVYINIWGSRALYSSVIYGHQTMNTKLYIYASAPYSMRYATIFSPVGEGSLLSMKCAGGACGEMKIYDDWTTEIYMQPIGSESLAFEKTQIHNIFDNSTLNISRSDANYIGLNTAYRAPVFLNGCNHNSSWSWWNLRYYGHNHGDWILYGTGEYMFREAIVYAAADIPPYNGKHGYDIKLIGNADDTLTEAASFIWFQLHTDGNTGANIYVDVSDVVGFSSAVIRAWDANLVNIY